MSWDPEQVRVQQAADRVTQLSSPGTPERVWALMDVAREYNLPAWKILDELTRRADVEDRRILSDVR